MKPINWFNKDYFPDWETMDPVFTRWFVNTFTKEKQMSLHLVEFNYTEAGYGDMEIELDDTLSLEEKKQAAERIIRDEAFPDVETLEIIEIKEV